MMSSRGFWTVVFCAVSCLIFPKLIYATALDDYVAEDDLNYSYTEVSSSFKLIPPTQGYVLRLTSQQWRDVSEVDQVVWEHWVTVTVPILVSTSNTAPAMR